MSQLQELMKDKLEDLDFDNLDTVFPEWVAQIRKQLNQKAEEIGVEITGLQISNLSPTYEAVRLNDAIDATTRSV